MTRLLVAVAVAAVALAIPALAQDTPAVKAAKELTGTYAVKEVNFDGKPAPDEIVREIGVDRIESVMRAVFEAFGLVLVDEGHRRFPRGSFYQERESIAILALAQVGRSTEARARAQRFLDAHPGSAYAERLRGLVAAP